MKKFGFTLAEILIALSIVGVVAAISIPGLVTENNKKVWANSLSTAVSDFENAMTSYILTEGGTELTDIDAFKGAPIAAFYDDFSKKRMKLKKVAVNIGGYYNDDYLKSLNPKSKLNVSVPLVGNYSISVTSTIFMENKKGIMYSITDRSIAAKKGPANLKLQKPVAILMIDVNGKKMPNRLGRDVYFYIISNDGYLFPLGGEDHRKYLRETGSSVSFVQTVEKNCTPKSNDIVAGLFCADRLAGNGYKMDY